MSDSVRHQVFVSSTFTDLREERQKVAEALLQIDCIPAGMELFPAVDAEQFEFIKTVIDDCDYYVVIIGGRYGSLSEEGLSFTEMEYRYALEKRIPVLAFIHQSPDLLPVGRSDVDPALKAKLEAFKAELRKRRLVTTWTSPDDLVTKVVMAIIKARKIHPRPGWIRGDRAASKELMQDLIRARTRIAELEAELLDRTTTENDISFNTFDLAYEADGVRHDVTFGLDLIYMTVASVMAVPTRYHVLEDALVDIVKRRTLKRKVSVLAGELDRLITALYGKGLVEIAVDEHDFRTVTITKKGNDVLAQVIADRQGDPDPPDVDDD